MRWLRSRRARRAVPTADELAVETVRKQGVNIRREVSVVHTLEFDEHLAALLAAELVHKPSRQVTVERGAHGGWRITICIRQNLLADTRQELRAEFEAVAFGLGGAYGGWRIADAMGS